MKNHSLFMVFLLILALSLTTAVSAGDNQTVSDAEVVLESQGEIEMDVQTNCEMPEDAQVLSCQYDDSSNSQFSVSKDEDIQSMAVDSNYELGYEITSDFIASHEIDDADDVLVIINAGYLEIDNKTTKNFLNGIIDASNGYITYEDGNLLTLSSDDDSLFVSFFLKNDESLTIAMYKDSITPLYYGNVGPEMFASQLENLILDEDDLNSYLTILNSWTKGNLDDLNLITHNSVPFGLSSEYNMLQTAKYYPHEFNLPLVDALGVSRDFDDDAFILEKTNSSDERASFDVNMVGRSMEESSSLNLYEIGVDATNKALNYLKLQGVDIPKDYPYLYVLTSAGNVRVNGQKTDRVLDGILDALGSGFNRKHLITVDDPSWKDLVFYFVVVKNTKHLSYALEYDSKSTELIKSDEVKKLGDKKVKNWWSHSNTHKRHVTAKKITYVALNSTDDDLNQTTNVTLKTADNSTENVSNVSNDVNRSEKDIEMPVENHGSPFNILYTLTAILMVCVIFGVGYRKR